MANTRLKIRLRDRVQSSPREGLSQAWSEWQVVDGNKVISRHDFEHQAIAWRDKHALDYPAQAA